MSPLPVVFVYLFAHRSRRRGGAGAAGGGRLSRCLRRQMPSAAGSRTRVHGKAERHDAFGCSVRTVSSVSGDSVEQFVCADEVEAANVPMRLLHVDSEGLAGPDDWSEETSRDDGGGR